MDFLVDGAPLPDRLPLNIDSERRQSWVGGLDGA